MLSRLKMDPICEKASYKEIHLPLGVVGVCREEHLWPTLEESARARELGICKKWTPITIDSAHKRDAVELGLRTYSARGAVWGVPILSPPAAEPAEWVLRAPRAPLLPKHRARSAPSSAVRLPRGERGGTLFSSKMWGRVRVQPTRT